MSVAKDFEELRLAVLHVDEDNTGSACALEPLLVQILGMVRSHPEDRDFFVRQFVRMATGELSAPNELVEFCMRELRFPEVLQAVRSKFEALFADNRHARYMNYCSDISHVYSDFVWRDVDIWAYFRIKELTPSILPELIDRLTWDDREAVSNAIFALGEMGVMARSAIPSLERFITHCDERDGLRAAANSAVQSILDGGTAAS